MSTRVTTVTSWMTTLALLCFVCFSSDADGSVITFTSSATSIKPLISSNLTLRCGLLDTSPVGSIVGRSLTGERVRSVTDKHISVVSDDPNDPNDLDGETLSKRSLTQTTENMGFVTSIMISRDGVDLATITEHFPARQVGGASGFQVSGHIPGASGDKGELQIVWPHPTSTDSGSYECAIATLTKLGKSYYFSQSLDVTEDEVTLTDLVSQMHQMKLDKEQTDVKIVNQADSIQSMKATIANQTKAIDSLVTSEEKLKTENLALSQSLEALRKTARVEPSIFFSASLSTAETFSSNQRVIYDTVHSNEGGAYNNKTGIFTVPVDGFYHLEVHVYSVYGKNAYLQLRRNGIYFLSVVTYGGSGSNGHNEATNSVTLRLSKGDTINVGSYATTSYLYSDNIDHVSANTFNGHLLALD